MPRFKFIDTSVSVTPVTNTPVNSKTTSSIFSSSLNVLSSFKIGTNSRLAQAPQSSLMSPTIFTPTPLFSTPVASTPVVQSKSGIDWRKKNAVGVVK